VKCKEHEETERIRVRACLAAMTKLIESNRENFEKYMEKSFNERDKLYMLLNQTISTAIDKGDSDIAKYALDCMAKVYNKNPMDGYEKVKESLNTRVNGLLE
jgi:hypothetical protein